MNITELTYILTLAISPNALNNKVVQVKAVMNTFSLDLRTAKSAVDDCQMTTSNQYDRKFRVNAYQAAYGMCMLENNPTLFKNEVVFTFRDIEASGMIDYADISAANPFETEV